LAHKLATGGPNEKNAILGKKGLKGSRDLLLEFWASSISRERLKLETLNVACRLATGETKQNNAKLGQKGSIRGHVTYFLKCWDPLHISGTVKARNFKIFTQIGHWAS